MSRTIAAACAAALTFGIVAMPAAAHADAVAVDDGTGDIWMQQYEAETDSWVWVESVADVNVDVVKAVVKHTGQRLAVTVTFAELRRDAEYRPTYWSHFKLADGRRATAVAWMDEQLEPAQYITVQKEPGGKYDKNLDCPGFKTDFHWADDTLTMSIPRSCYGTPRHVRFHGTSVGAYSNPEPGHETDWFWDNAGDGGPDENPSGPWTDRLKAG